MSKLTTALHQCCCWHSLYLMAEMQHFDLCLLICEIGPVVGTEVVDVVVVIVLIVIAIAVVALVGAGIWVKHRLSCCLG